MLTLRTYSVTMPTAFITPHSTKPTSGISVVTQKGDGTQIDFTTTPVLTVGYDSLTSK